MIDWSDMIKGYIKSILSWFTSKPIILFAIAVVCFVVLALPESWRIYLGYDELIKPYRGWISLAALISGVLWLIAILAKLIDLIRPWIRTRWESWWFYRKAPNILRELSRQEKQYVAKYVKEDVSTLDWHAEDGVIGGLEAKKIVFVAAKVIGRYIPWNLQPWVMKTLKKHSDLKNEILEHCVEETKIL